MLVKEFPSIVEMYKKIGFDRHMVERVAFLEGDQAFSADSLEDLLTNGKGILPKGFEERIDFFESCISSEQNVLYVWTKNNENVIFVNIPLKKKTIEKE